MSSVCDDPLARLEQMAKRQSSEEKAAKAFSKARVRLVLGKDAKAAFFATLALRMKPVANWDIQTARTDGRTVEYNPTFVENLSPDQLVGVITHEVMHIAVKHHCRRQGRDVKRWNVAGDLAINDILKDAGFTLPTGALYPGQGQYSKLQPNLSAEEYYDQLPKEHGKDGDEGDDPGGCGGVEDAGDQAQQKAASAEADVQIAQAATVAKHRGELPGGLARLVDEILNPKVPWQDVLREFLSRTLSARDDYTWGMPNRRFIAQGIYLPSLRSEVMGDIVVAIDTSGSIGDDELRVFGGELNGILECHPCSVSVVYCDAHVNNVEHWEPSDGPLTLKACGGGGTDHAPVFDWIREQGIDPAAVVCLTDGYTNFPKAPQYPVLWAMTSDVVAPFGRTIKIE